MKKNLLLALAASAAPWIPISSAHAQSLAVGANPNSETRSHSATQDNSGIADIIVTAQRRSENVQKSSLSIQVLGSQEVARAGVTEAKDLSTLVPGLQVGAGGSATQIFIRGVGDFSAAQIANPAVSFNVDGVVVARPQAVGTAFYDVERIEVLKGPQGTLYGRNSSGGAINLITRKPDLDTVSGYVTAEAGNLGLKHGSGALNIPLTSTLAIRGAFDVMRRDGYLTDGTNDDKHDAARLRLLWEPSDRFKMLTTFEWSHVHGNGPGYALYPRPSGTTPYLGIGDPRALAYISSQQPFGAAQAVGLANFSPFIDNRAINISSEISYDMNWATLTVLPAYRDFKDSERNYPTSSNLQNFHSRQFSTEARLNRNTDRAKWVAGLYYFRESVPGANIINTGVPAIIDGEYTTNLTRSYAAFGQLSYSLASRFRLIGGARFTVDDRKLAGVQTSLIFLTPPPVVEVFQGTKKYRSFTWKAGAEYDLEHFHDER